MSGTFRFLEDIALADAAFEVHADSPSELFEAAAQAIIQTMADPTTVGCTWRRAVQRQDESIGALLFEWLSDIVYWKDAAGVVLHDATATVREEVGWRLDGTLTGEPVASGRQDLRADIKAITKHLYDVQRTGEGRWTARVVIDL